MMSSKLPWSLLWQARPPRIHVLSDIHLDSGPYEIPVDLEFDLLVAAGDIGPIELAVPWLAAVGKPVVYVLGNHEYSGRDIFQAADEARELAKGTNVHVLERDSVVIDGVRFLGATLWTNFGNWNPMLVQTAHAQMQDYQYIRVAPWYQQPNHAEAVRLLATAPKMFGLRDEEGLFSPALAYSIHQDTIAWLERQLSETYAGPTIVVTHHAPTMACLAAFGVGEEMLNPSNWPRLEHHRDITRVAAYASSLELFLARHRTKIAAWVHGHLHMHADLLVEGVRVSSNARGYAIPPIEESGLREKGDDIKRCGLGPSGSEYLGDARDFDRSFVVDLATGFEVPLQQVVAECIEELSELIDDCKNLLPYVHCEQDVPRYAVRRSFAENIRSGESMLDEVISDSAAAIDERIGSVLGRLSLPAQLPTLNSSREHSADAAAELTYAHALTLLESWRDWCAKLPFAANAELTRWCQAALLSVEQLERSGKSVLVLSPGWRAAFDLGELRRIALVMDEEFNWDEVAMLDSLLAAEDFKGFLPTFERQDTLDAAERRRLLSSDTLRAALIGGRQ